ARRAGALGRTSQPLIPTSQATAAPRANAVPRSATSDHARGPAIPPAAAKTTMLAPGGPVRTRTHRTVDTPATSATTARTSSVGGAGGGEGGRDQEGGDEEVGHSRQQGRA